MASWVKFNRLSQQWSDAKAQLAHRKNPAAREWFNLNTGAAIAAIADGPWDEDRESRTWVRVFHRSPEGSVVELTAAMFPNGETEYDRMAVGKDRYGRPMWHVEKRIDASLGMRDV